MNANDKQHRAILQRIARRVMLERGLLPDFSVEALAELARIQAPATMDGEQVVTLGTFCGLPLTTMTPLTWISLPLPRRCLETK
jgi:hypothetical protein